MTSDLNLNVFFSNSPSDHPDYTETLASNSKSFVARARREAQGAVNTVQASSLILNLLKASLTPEQGGLSASQKSLIDQLNSGIQGGQNFVQAFNSLDPNSRTSLSETLGESRLEQIISLSKVSNAEIFWDQILHFGIEQKIAGRVPLAFSIFNYLKSDSNLPEPLRTQASRESDAIEGKGSNALRGEFLLSTFLQNTTDYRSILPMIGASMVGPMVGVASLGGLSRMGTAWYSRGLTARAIMGTASYLAELSTFALGSHALSLHPEDNNLGNDFKRAALTIGALRFASFAGNQAFLWSNSLNEATALGLSGFTKVNQWLIPQVATFGGLMGANALEQRLGLRPEVEGATSVVDTLGSMASLGIGMGLAHGILGARFANFQKEMGLRSEIFTQFGDIAARKSAQETPRTRALALANSSLMMPFWMMMGTGGIGGGGSGESGGGSGKFKKTTIGGISPEAAGASKPGDMDDAYSIAGALVRDKLSQNESQALEALKEKDIVVVKGNFDHIDRVLRALGVPFVEVKPEQLSPLLLEGAKFVFTNCGSNFPLAAAGMLEGYVRAGGLMMTTDWALKNVLEASFVNGRNTPLYVKHNGQSTGSKNPNPGRPELVGISEFKKDVQIMQGLFEKGGEPQWWLEPSSYPIEIVDKDAVEVLARSEELGKRYGADPVVVRFPHGKGGIIHMISHFFLQHGGPKPGEVDVDAAQYATDLGASAQVIDQVKKHTQGKPTVTKSTVRSATTSMGFVTSTLTGNPFTKQTGVVSPGESVPEIKMPGTATVGKTGIGEMLGVPKSAPVTATPVESPQLLSWQPIIRNAVEWRWSEGFWHYDMAKDQKEVVFGRQGDVMLQDKRPTPLISRKHFKIQRIDGDEGTAYFITALGRDISIVRGEEYIYLSGTNGNLDGKAEGEKQWLQPGDKVMLAPDVSFVFDPSH